MHERYLDQHNVTLIRGRGSLSASGGVTVGDTSYEASHILIATGSTLDSRALMEPLTSQQAMPFGNFRSAQSTSSLLVEATSQLNTHPSWLAWGRRSHFSFGQTSFEASILVFRPGARPTSSNAGSLLSKEQLLRVSPSQSLSASMFHLSTKVRQNMSRLIWRSLEHLGGHPILRVLDWKDSQFKLTQITAVSWSMTSMRRHKLVFLRLVMSLAVHSLRLLQSARDAPRRPPLRPTRRCGQLRSHSNSSLHHSSDWNGRVK